MQRKLIVLAVAAALGAPAVALAEASTVQLYGKITAEYGYVDQGSGKPNTDLFQTPGGSAIGLKGEEQLGGGLSAWFQCESSADVRGANQDGFCGRNSALGLKGPFGNVHFGRWDTPFKRVLTIGKVGAESTGLFGSAFLLAGNSTGTKDGDNRNVWRRRQASMVYYESPALAGFQVLAGFSTGNHATAALNSTTSAKPRVLSISAGYNNGPLRFGAGYERHNEFGSVGGSNDDHAWVVAGSYTFMGKLKIGGSYNRQKYENTATMNSTKKAWNLGVDWKIKGPHGVQASFTKADDITGTASIANGATAIDASTVPLPGANTGARLWQIAYVHTFSKRTSAKFGYIRLDNDSNALYALGGSRVAGPGADQNAWATYWTHTF